MTRYSLKNEIKFTLEIKKSQFITWLKAVDSREEAMAYLQQAKVAYPDARHHCWAYVLGDSPNSQTAAMSDDGEPSGTAGKPMLNVLQHKPVNNVMAIVIRYFGGIKLGAGGLVRAYSQAIEQAYGEAELEPVIAKTQVQVKLDFSQEQWLRHHSEQLSGDIIDVKYSNCVQIDLSLPIVNLTELEALLVSKSIKYKTDRN